MAEAYGDPEHFIVFAGEFDGYVPAKGWRAAAQVDGYIEDGAMGDADELSLRLDDLIVEAAEDVFGGDGGVVLSPVFGKAGLDDAAVIEGLEECAAVVAIDWWA